ncbi:GumC family protein [Candidatus Nitrospira bockiana]
MIAWHKYRRILLAYRWMLLSLSLSSLVGAVALTYVLPEKYDATAVVLVRPHEQIRTVNSRGEKEILDYPVSQLAPIDAPSKTYIKVITSRALVEEVVRTLQLDKKTRLPSANPWKELWEQFKEWGKEWAEWARDMVKYGRAITLSPFLKAVERVEKGLTLTATKDTYIFDIKHEASDPQEAADVANTAAEVFIHYMAKANTEEAGDNRKFLAERLAEADEEVAQARAALRTFKEKHHTFLLSDEYTSRLNVIGDLEKELEKTESKLSGVLEYYTPSHPKAKTLQAEKERLMRSLKQANEEIARNAEKEKELENLKLRVKVAEDKYELLSKGFEDARTRETSRTSEIRVVSRAEAPTYPSKPVKLYYGLGGLAVGLLLGIGLAFFLELQIPRLRSVDEVEEALHLPILATIPFTKKP